MIAIPPQHCLNCQTLLNQGDGRICLQVQKGVVVDFGVACYRCGSGFKGPTRSLSEAGVKQVEEDFEIQEDVRVRLEAIGLPVRPAREEEKPMITKSAAKVAVEEIKTKRKYAKKMTAGKTKPTTANHYDPKIPVLLTIGGETCEITIAFSKLQILLCS